MVRLVGLSNLLMLVGGGMLINGVFITLQNRRLSKEILALRRLGTVLAGNQRGLLMVNKVIVLLAVDHKNVIRGARKLTHLGPFQSVRTEELPLGGKRLNEVKQENFPADYAAWRAYRCAVSDKRLGGCV